MSSQFESRLRNGFHRLAPVARNAPAVLGSLAVTVGGRARQRLRRSDPAGALIGFADAVERGLAKSSRLVRRTRGPRGLGLTGGLLWRGLAAMTGIGLTAGLVTAISEAGSNPTLASLTLAPGQESRPVRDVRQAPRPGAAADDAWIRIVRPVAMFGLESPELERQPAIYEAQRSQSGARRQDSLVFGDFGEPKPHLELRLLIDRGVAEPTQPFVIALVRAAAERGMSVQRSGVPTAIETRFGAVEAADATLSDGQASRACIAFRKGAGEMPLGFNGWWCGGARPADRQQLVCLLDRLALLSAGDDAALRTAFARSELNRQSGCVPARLSASGRKASWLDADGHAPALKAASRR